MTVTWIDRLKIRLYLLMTGGTRVTKEEHDQQRDLVRASELRGTDKTEAHALYPLRRTSGGYTNGPVIRNTVGGWRNGTATPPRPVQPEARP